MGVHTRVYIGCSLNRVNHAFGFQIAEPVFHRVQAATDALGILACKSVFLPACGQSWLKHGHEVRKEHHAKISLDLLSGEPFTRFLFNADSRARAPLGMA